MREIRTETEIAAPPDAVWDELTDLESYAEWNPFIIEASGVIRAGEKLRLRMSPPEGRPMSFRPTVKVAEPGRELRWLGRLGVPGVFDGEHYFRLEPSGHDGTRLVQGERFTGILVGLTGKTLEKTERGFEALNQALRERCEKP